MIENWVDTLCKVWEIDDGRGGTVWSPRIFGKDEFPEAIDAARPTALTFLTNTATSYSAGGPCINLYTGYTEFHLAPNLSRSSIPAVLKFIKKIEVAAAGNARLGGIVEHFLLTSEGQPSIQGPVVLQYGEEAEHLGLVVHWEVKENVSGQFNVTA
jgi:hypothetical protein